MSSDYSGGQGPSFEELLAKVQAKAGDINAIVEKKRAERVCKPKPFFRGDGPTRKEQAQRPNAEPMARKKKRKRKIAQRARRRNR